MAINILVTGGAGYIGSHVCKALNQAGYCPITFDNMIHGHEWAVKWGPLVYGELASHNLLTWVFNEYLIHGVIHLAAFSNVSESMQRPITYFRNNVTNTLNLLEAMEHAKVKNIVFSSTAAVYGIPDIVPIMESHSCNPINPYGESKHAIEKMLHWYKQAYGLNYMSLRYFNAAGADLDNEIGEDHQPETHLIPLAIQAALGKRQHIEIFGSDYRTPDGTAIRDYIHVTDLANAHVLALQHLMEGKENTILNLGTGQGHSVYEIIDCIQGIGNRKVPVKISPRRAGDPLRLIAYSGKAFRLLNWKTKYSDLPTIIGTAWRWYESNHKIFTNK